MLPENRFSFLSVKSTLSILYFTLVYLFSSFYVSIMPGYLMLALSILVVFVVFLLKQDNFINWNIILLSFVLFINVLITSIYVEESFKISFIMLTTLFVSVSFVLLVDTLLLFEIFSNIMYVISIYSLITYVVSCIVPSVIYIFPSTYNINGLMAFNVGLSFVNINNYLIRNMGLFWEPGAFQTYLVFAILFEKYKYNLSRPIRIFVFMLAIISTWSTVGIINLFLLTIVIVIESKCKICVIIYAFLLAIIFMFYEYLPEVIKHFIFGKIYDFIFLNSTEVTSASVRYDSTIYPFYAFLSHPFIGIGYVGLEKSIPTAHSMTTNTILNWFAVYGIIYGSIFINAIIKFTMTFSNKHKISYMLIFIIILLSLSTEEYSRNPSIIIIILSFYNLND